MKKIFFLLIMVSFCKTSFSQNEATNIISIDPSQIYFKTFSIAYEKLINENKNGVRITTAFGKNYFEFGGDYKFYLANFGETNFSIGGLDLGVGEFRVFTGPSLLFIKTKSDELALAPRVTGGISWDFSEGLYLMIAGYGGYTQFVKRTSTSVSGYVDYWVISGVGYRF